MVPPIEYRVDTWCAYALGVLRSNRHLLMAVVDKYDTICLPKDRNLNMN